MESFAFNMGWVLLATILPSVIAFMVCSSLLFFLLPPSSFLEILLTMETCSQMLEPVADDQFLSAETAKKQADAKPSEA